MPNRFRLLLLVLLALVLSWVLAPRAADGQPFGSWIILDDATPGYIQIPHSPALNPTSAFTLEAWVSLPADTGCRSLVGKDFMQSWWVGVCGTTLRSFLRGAASARNAGMVPLEWTHIAVTFNGTHRRHYINGELVGQWAETGPLTTSAAPLRIGSDVSWQFTPSGAVDEVRLWNVARTTAQIRADLNERFDSPKPGLVAVWGMNGAVDELGSHSGSLVGSPAFLTFPVAANCMGTPTSLCLRGRFVVSVRWRDFADNTGPGRVVPFGSIDSGLFWFFAPSNWEMLIKVVNGCTLNDRWWVFFAATTTVFYRMEVIDVPRGAQKIYFNYPGQPSPAVTDTQAFATCP